MPRTAPLQILLFRDVRDVDLTPYEDAIVRAFQGGKEAGGYIVTGEDLGIQMRPFAAVPAESVATMLDGFCHTLTIVLIDREFLGQHDDTLWKWLADCWMHTDRSNGRHAMIAAPMDERLGDQFAQKHPAFGTLQLRSLHELGERAIRPAMLALLLLHESRVLLAEGLPQALTAGSIPGHLKLFISHAKIDGLPLAQALRHQIQAIPWLRSFYDADDLPVGRNWQRELERGVGSSLIIMLRTEVYDSRHWCQQEVRWADEYATPAVLVDARTGLSHSATPLPFDRMPTVRIPDGNLMRILFVALREGVRFLYFARLVEAMKHSGELPTNADLRVFSYSPSMPALLRACGSFPATAMPAGGARIIVYPDPPLRTGHYEAASALVAAHAPGAQLVTPNTLAATAGTNP